MPYAFLEHPLFNNALCLACLHGGVIVFLPVEMFMEAMGDEVGRSRKKTDTGKQSKPNARLR